MLALPAMHLHGPVATSGDEHRRHCRPYLESARNSRAMFSAIFAVSGGSPAGLNGRGRSVEVNGPLQLDMATLQKPQAEGCVDGHGGHH